MASSQQAENEFSENPNYRTSDYESNLASKVAIEDSFQEMEDFLDNFLVPR